MIFLIKRDRDGREGREMDGIKKDVEEIDIVYFL